MSLWLALMALLVIAMVAVGGATRLTDSGLSITEWKPIIGALPPLSTADWADAFAKYKQIPEYKIVNQGMSLEEFKFIFWWEWGHRFLGRFIGLAYALPLLLFWLAGRIPPGFKLPLVVVLLLGGLQGFVGWYMVQSGLAERVDVSQYRLAMHLTLAFVILGALIWLAIALWPTDPLDKLQPVAWLSRGVAIVLALGLLGQVVLGAFVAGTKAGLIYNTWPLIDGAFLPDGLWQETPWYFNLTEDVLSVQFNHRMLAYGLVLLALLQAVTIGAGTDSRRAMTSAWLLALGLVVQAGLGIWTLVAAEGSIPIGLGVAHQTFAAIVFVVAVWHVRVCVARV